MVAGDPEHSLLISAVTNADASRRMPPKEKLTDCANRRPEGVDSHGITAVSRDAAQAKTPAPAAFWSFKSQSIIQNRS